MTLKKKILVAALALGTVLGFGSGIRQMKQHHYACARAAWSQLDDGPPCGRRGPQGHWGGRGHWGGQGGWDGQGRWGGQGSWGGQEPPPPAAPEK